MLKRRLVTLATLVMAMLVCAAPALAQAQKTYAVLPFEYNGPKKYSYFPKALQQTLASDLEWSGHVLSAPDSTVDGMSTPKSKADALTMLNNTGVDYVLSGSISILNKDATINMTMHGADNSFWEKKGQVTIDEITPWLDDQAKTIQGDVFQRPGYGEASKVADMEMRDEAAAAANAPINSGFVAGDASYQADKLNPQFRYEGGSSSIGRWRSQTLRFPSSSMVVTDGDGDGNNEVFILNEKGISAYRFKQGKLDHLETLPLSVNIKNLRLEMADLNRDDLPEFVVSTYKLHYRSAMLAPEGRPQSHILSFKDGKFKFLVKDFNWFLGIYKMPPTYMPILVCQRTGSRNFFDNRIKEAYYKNGEIHVGSVIGVPEYANIYNVAFLPEGMGYKWVVLDDYHRLKVYDQTMERLSTTDADTYNSSGIGLEYSERPPGMGPGLIDNISSTYNLPMRMLPVQLSTKKKWELLVNKDISAASAVFEAFTYYSQGEIHSLAWDGVGMTLAWKTRRIKGQVSDIALADLNNDGNEQLVVLLNTFPGGLGFTKRKTVVLAYDLNLD